MSLPAGTQGEKPHGKGDSHVSRCLHGPEDHRLKADTATWLRGASNVP